MNKGRGCAPSVVAPTQLPATDGQCVSPSSRFLTLNWSSLSVRSETMGESSLGDPGPGDEATRDWSGRAVRERLRQNTSGRERVRARPIIRVSSAFREGTRWGLFTPLWVLEAPCSHFLLSFVTNQVPFSPSSSPPFLSSSLLFPFLFFLYQFQAVRWTFGVLPQTFCRVFNFNHSVES